MTSNNIANNSGSIIPLAFIEIEGITTDIEIGILPSEIGRIQRIKIDITVGFDDSMTRIHDNETALSEFGFDSRKVRDVVINACKTKSSLLETLANKIADETLLINGTYTVYIKIIKSHSWADTDKSSLIIRREK
jgi:dihydroneopterin aldolase